MICFLPADFGVKTAAAAAFGEIPKLFVVEFVVFVTGVRGVKDGESTLRKRLALCMISVVLGFESMVKIYFSFCWVGFATSWLYGHPVR